MRKMLLTFGTALAVILWIINFQPLMAQDVDDIVAELQGELDLSDTQASQMGDLMTKQVTGLKAVVDKSEEADEPDPQAMIGDMKKVKGEYRTGIEEVLSPQQLGGYDSYVDQVKTQIFSEVAGMRLLDLQPVLNMTDDQMELLKPVMAEATKGVLGVLWEYGDKKLNLRNKLAIGGALKKIKSSTKSSMSEILDEGQMAALEDYRKEQKEAKEDK